MINPLRRLATSYFALLALLNVALLNSAMLQAEITVETVMVPMRDGVLLATTVYRDPSITSGPVVLMRTPYNKNGGKVAAERFAEAEYVAVVEANRGKVAS